MVFTKLKPFALDSRLPLFLDHAADLKAKFEMLGQIVLYLTWYKR